ncbi:hypothetical protein QTP86_021381, partial [Hemibagrus guttatus]
FCATVLVAPIPELMNIRATTPVDLFPSFLASTADLLAILIKEARNKVKSHRRGKRSGVLVRLRRCGICTALLGIFLSNVSSLCNKMDELTLHMNKNKDFPTSCVLGFTETWLCELIQDSALQLGGFNLHRADRHTELSSNAKGGEICFYINNSWCSDVKVLSQLCSPDLEAFIINCKSFYSPRLVLLIHSHRYLHPATRSEKEAAFRSGDKEKYKEAKYRFSKEVRRAKTKHGERMKQQFQTNDSASVWKGLKEVTNYKSRAPHSVKDLRLANSLNEYYCRFERQ